MHDEKIADAMPDETCCVFVESVVFSDADES